MTSQEIFETVSRHLLKQNRRAVEVTVGRVLCRYRFHTPDGCLKCAVGCLIPDEVYVSDMEGKPVETIVRKHNNLPAYFQDHLELLDELQGVHDGNVPAHWFALLKELGEDWGLTFPEDLEQYG